jgi:exopolyphosphatase/guanosine-5'-triphosphate,3'-diphosphate pyrophosphatase
MTMSREARMIVNKLAALLRVADALDVSRTQSIRDFRCRIDNNGFVISVPAGLDLILERRSLAEKADMFQDIYGLDVVLEEVA